MDFFRTDDVSTYCHWMAKLAATANNLYCDPHFTREMAIDDIYAVIRDIHEAIPIPLTKFNVSVR